MADQRGIGFWVLIIIAVLITLVILIGQTGCLIDYDFAVSIGMQESIEEITGVGVAFAKGFAFGDTLFYMPLFIIGIVGLLKRRSWGLFSMVGALSITVYWPIFSLYAVYAGKTVMNLAPYKYTLFPILLPLFSIYALWGLIYLYTNRDTLAREKGGQ